MKERNKLYTTLTALWVLGWTWLAYSSTTTNGHGVWKGCLWRQLFGIPCSSCGTTRAIRDVFNGDLATAVNHNPYGLLLAAIMVLFPFWLSYDLILQRSSLLESYKQMERIIRRPVVAFPLIILAIANWCWNIYKYA